MEKVASQVSVRAVTGIEKCAVIDFKGNASNPALQTDGVNFEGIWMLSDDLDLNQLTTNNVASMLKVSTSRLSTVILFLLGINQCCDAR